MKSVPALLAPALVCALFALPAQAADQTVYPDTDTDKPCTSPGESPECAAKTFWLCTEKSVATCKLAGLNVQADGTQHKDDGTMKGAAWFRPWAQTWNELRAVTHPDYTVWQIEGWREVNSQRLRGVPGTRRNMAGDLEMMITLADASGMEERESVFLAERKGVWSVTGYARWREGRNVTACEKRKLGSLACRYTIPGITSW